MHKSVLVNEVLEFLKPEKGKIILDATVGSGGHTEEILKNITPAGQLIGIDCDKKILKIAQQRLSNFKGNYELVYDNFKNLRKALDKLNIKTIDGALLIWEFLHCSLMKLPAVLVLEMRQG